MEYMLVAQLSALLVIMLAQLIDESLAWRRQGSATRRWAQGN